MLEGSSANSVLWGKALVPDDQETTPSLPPLDNEISDDSFYKMPTRKVVQKWPRDPSGKEMTLGSILGIQATGSPNKFPWAATIDEIYTVDTLTEPLTWSMTGGAIARWMEENGESDFAVDHMNLVRNADRPKIVDVYPHDQILIYEEKVISSRKGHAGTSITAVERGDKSDYTVRLLVQSPTENESTLPWPLVPFSYQPGKLQMKIPFEELPETLIVHDPWNVLKLSCSNSQWSNDVIWTSSTNDATLVYKLTSQPSPSTAREDQNSNNDIAQSFVFRLPCSDPAQLDESITIRVLHDPPPKVERSSNAHLYISPSHFLGRGNHSEVYSVEWEIPRSLLRPRSCPPYILCRECVTKDIQQALKMAGDDDHDHETHQDFNGSTTSIESLITIRTTVPWQDVSHPTCIHLKSELYVPPTARVRVTAKLSIPGDDHLVNEARNYEMFEAQMFEHWSGLNLIPETRASVPVGAIVPQFYGFYVPEKGSHPQGPHLSSFEQTITHLLRT
ncbi:hypothetical protein H0H87_000246 [Tephrocybe sp. NHM501043]|nr:hypothetical protein H0H87_000246 [Tephrocybe sp. NHM501043]